MGSEAERSPYAPPEADVGVAGEIAPRPVAVLLLQVAQLLQLLFIAYAVVGGVFSRTTWDSSSSSGVWVLVSIVAAYSTVLLIAFLGLLRRSFWGRWLSFLGLTGFAGLFLFLGMAGIQQHLSFSGLSSENGWFFGLLTGLGLLFLLWMYFVVFSNKARRFYGANL